MAEKMNDAQFRERIRELVSEALRARNSISILLRGLKSINDQLRREEQQGTNTSISGKAEVFRVRSGLVLTLGYNPWEFASEGS